MKYEALKLVCEYLEYILTRNGLRSLLFISCEMVIKLIFKIEDSYHVHGNYAHPHFPQKVEQKQKVK